MLHKQFKLFLEATQQALYAAQRKQIKYSEKINKAEKKKAVHTLDGIINELSDIISNPDPDTVGISNYVALLAKAITSRNKISESKNSKTTKTEGSTVKKDLKTESEKSTSTKEAEDELNLSIKPEDESSGDELLSSVSKLGPEIEALGNALDQITDIEDEGLNSKKEYIEGLLEANDSPLTAPDHDFFGYVVSGEIKMWF